MRKLLIFSVFMFVGYSVFAIEPPDLVPAGHQVSFGYRPFQ